MKQKPGIATRAVLLAVSLLWAIPLIWSVLTALKPSKESMLLQLPSTLTLENFPLMRRLRYPSTLREWGDRRFFWVLGSRIRSISC